MHQPVEKGRNGRRVTEELRPIVKWSIRCKNCRCALVAPHNDLEQILGSVGGEFSHPEIIDDEQRNLAEGCDRFAAFAGRAGRRRSSKSTWASRYRTRKPA